MKEKEKDENSNINLQKAIRFIKEIEGLKTVLRSGRTSAGRYESTAEHSWRLAMFAFVLEDEFRECDLKKVLKLSLIHDLGELYEGDIPATMDADADQKYDMEQRAIHKVSSLLSEDKAAELISLWDEYNQCETEEAKLVKALDKLETIIQHNQGDNIDKFDYAFNLDYGKAFCIEDKRILEMRKLIDKDTIYNVKTKQNIE